MKSLQDRYVELLLQCGVLRFGSFQTKSGRQSPYFFNAGHFDSGQRLGAVAALYAELIAERFGDQVENLYGPAYKGIPLAVMTSWHLQRLLGRDISFTFNRKEAKAHGEGGSLIGRAYQGGEKVVIIEDVITGGTSFNESIPLLRHHGAQVIGAVVGVDRQERGQGTSSALDEIKDRYGVATAAIVGVREIVDRLTGRPVLGQVWIDADTRRRIDAYLAEYGG